MRMKHILLLFLLITLINCSGSIKSLNIEKADNTRDRIDKVYIIPVMKHLSDNFYDAFISKFNQLLKNKNFNYRINSKKYFDIMEDELRLNTTENWKEHIRKDIANYSPEYILNIVMLKMRSFFTGLSEEPTGAIFEISILENIDHKEVWKAKLDYSFGHTLQTDANRGKKFAEILYNILIENHLITE